MGEMAAAMESDAEDVCHLDVGCWMSMGWSYLRDVGCYKVDLSSCTFMQGSRGEENIKCKESESDSYL